jgi:hypothetical protein
MPIYANSLTEICGQCGQERVLLLNPNIIGEIADETAGISAFALSDSPVSNWSPFTPLQPQMQSKKHNRLLIHPQAFADLFGCSSRALAEMCSASLSPQALQYNLSALELLEKRLLWMRVILMIGWTGDWGGGRLALLGLVR